jgi:hypothetical protein
VLPRAELAGTILGNGRVGIEVRAAGLPPGEVRAVEVHGGLRASEGVECGTGAPLIYRLNHLRVGEDGTGVSRTTILLTRDSPIEGGNAYLDVHENDISEPDTEVGSGALCAEVPVTFRAGAGAES